MLSSYPQFSAGGRSRFSKVLPAPPDSPSSPQVSLPPPPSLPLHSSKQMTVPSPPLETDAAPSLPALTRAATTMSIPRRPVGAQPNHVKTASSSSSIYSESPGISKRFSDSSTSDTKDSLSGIDSEEAGPTTPSPPSKDSRTQHEPPQSACNDLARPLTILKSSPPRPEIWKRRSVKSNKSISFTSLKLDWSNGSTASPPRKQEPSADPPLPRSLRGRKPVPSRPAPHPQPDLMGGKLAKLKNKLLRDRPDKSGNAAKVESYPSSHQYGAFQQLPKPGELESDKIDNEPPSVPHVLTPSLPDTPPVDDAPAASQKSQSWDLIPEVNALQATNELTLLASKHSRQSSETLTVTSEPTVMQSPQPQKAFAVGILTPQPSPAKTSPLSLPTPAVHSIRFPILPQIAPPGTVMPGLPVTELQLDCYQSHKYMRGTKNTLCPVACMVCGRKDREQRWNCTWCCLSACGPCMKVLTSLPERDLSECLERIRR